MADTTDESQRDQRQVVLLIHFLAIKTANPSGTRLFELVRPLVEENFLRWDQLEQFLTKQIDRQGWSEEFVGFTIKTREALAMVTPAVEPAPVVSLPSPRPIPPGAVPNAEPAPPPEPIAVAINVPQDIYQTVVDVLQSAGRPLEGIPVGDVLMTMEGKSRDGNVAIVELVHNDSGPTLVGYLTTAAGGFLGASAPTYKVDAGIRIDRPAPGYLLQLVPTPF